MRHTKNTYPADHRGFTVIELVIVMTVSGLLLSIGFASMRDYSRKQRARQAAEALAWSVQVARTYAIRAGRPMALIVDETNRTVLVRDTSGTVAYNRDFSDRSDFALEVLDLDLDGDSLVFSRRGLCMNCRSGGTTEFHVKSAGRMYALEVGLLGRTEIKVRN